MPVSHIAWPLAKNMFLNSLNRADRNLSTTYTLIQKVGDYTVAQESVLA